ncbi:Tetratricopeptide repeat protein 27-like protein [Drosera capensis]
MAESAPQLDLLRHFELRLLRCTLPPPSPPPPPPQSSPSIDDLHRLIDGIISAIEAGRFVEALSSESVRAVLGVNLIESVEEAELGEEIERIVEEYLVGGGDDVSGRAVLVMSIAVAALLAFVQCNVTGPIVELPTFPLLTKGGMGFEAWAREQLMSAGAELLGKFSYLQYIVFAKIMLMKTKDVLFGRNGVDGVRSISWWLARLLLLQQRILNERSSSLFDLLQVFIAESLHHFGDMERVASYWRSQLHTEEALNIVSMLQLEAGLADYAFGRVVSARQHIESAEAAAGIKLLVSGALGVRTVHQLVPKAQRVLIANGSSLNGLSAGSLVSTSLRSDATIVEENNFGTDETSDVLRVPRFSEEAVYDPNKESVTGDDYAVALSLKPTQQAVVAAQCLLIEKSTAQDELQRWDMAPYIEAIDSQKSSPFIIRCFSDILRIRWESTRGRTKQRALLMMGKLVEDLFLPKPEVLQRIHFCFGVHIPAVPALRKEHGELLVRNGLIGEALKIFEDLELWDNLIYCYRLLEKKSAAVELIKTRLSEVPNDPRLWCSLGDVTNDDACYEKALAVSNNRSVRAKRSLARSAYNRGDYETSKLLWESAMALNSLYPDGWFALGAAALKARDIEKALDSFTRAVQLDPENGEAWNNIACLHMVKKRSKEAVIAFKEALKFKRNSWQMWENYGRMAADVGNFAQAMEAMQMVLDLSKNRRVDLELLENFVIEMERRASFQESSSSSTTNGIDCNGQNSSGYEAPSPRETKQLMETLGKIFQLIVRSNPEGDVWGLYARWHRMKGDLTMWSEALLKQVRSYQGSELWKDADRFKKFARASLDLCKAEIFSDTEEFKALEVCLDDVRSRRLANSEARA